MRQVRLWATFVLLGLVVLFTLQNVTVVDLTFLIWTFRLPRALLVFLILIVGFVAGWILRSVMSPARSPAPPDRPR
jgi:uncharacterized integral membrane protein